MRREPVVLVDATDIDRPSGARTAVYELLLEIFRQAPTWRFRVLVSEREAGFGQPNVTQHIVPIRRRILERIWVQIVVAALAVTRSVDLVHFARTLGGFAWPVPSVLTVFDLTTVVRPELHSAGARWYWQHIMPLHLRSATALVAISENVAEDLVKYYHIARDKVHVIYCAPQSVFDTPMDDAAADATRRKFGLPDEYVLFVGMLARKKNLSTLVAAMALLRDRGIQTSLVMAGRRYSQSDDKGILDLVREKGLTAQVHYLGPVSQDDLRALYSGAQTLVYPSLHEGFGIPCIEAMKCGVPVIASQSGAVPEIVDDAAILIDDPMDADGFASAIESVLTNSDLRRTLVLKGHVRTQQYRWPKSASQTLRVYNLCLPTPPDS
jgi:glycosyltransferase involved in cell wall biosynthesis